MTPPDLSHGVWLLGALDPILILVAVWLGWKADQLGKVFIAAIAAFGVAVLASRLIYAVGIPWPAPIGTDMPTFYPVRVVGALVWAGAAYAARRLARR